MLNGKVMIIHLIVGLIKKALHKMSQYIPKPYEPFGGDINVKVDLSNYATKTDLKNATGIDTSKLAAKSDLASLKAEVGKIDVDKLNTVPDDLSKLKSKADKLFIDKLAPVPDDLSKLSNLVKHDKHEVKGEIPIINNVATTIALTAVENKIPNVSNLVKKKLTIRQKLIKLERKSQIRVMIIALLIQNLIS